jgi:hypothetical protein
MPLLPQQAVTKSVSPRAFTNQTRATAKHPATEQQPSSSTTG